MSAHLPGADLGLTDLIEGHMFDFLLKRSSSKLEAIALTVHVCIGIAMIGFLGRALAGSSRGACIG